VVELLAHLVRTPEMPSPDRKSTTPRFGRMRHAIARWLERRASPELFVALRSLAGSAAGPRRRPAFLPRRLYVERSPERQRILVLAPHPDDEAIGLGGSLSAHLACGSAICVVYLTDGRGPRSEDRSLVAKRRREARSVGEHFGFEQRFWDVADNHLQADEESLDRLARTLEEISPTSVYVPSFFEHQRDHRAASLLLVGALEKLGWPPLHVLGYEVWDLIPFPNHVVDTSEHFERKAAMLAHYATPHEHTDFTALCRHRDALHYGLLVDSGRREPEGYAEAFLRADGVTYGELCRDWIDHGGRSDPDG